MVIEHARQLLRLSRILVHYATEVIKFILIKQIVYNTYQNTRISYVVLGYGLYIILKSHRMRARRDY